MPITTTAVTRCHNGQRNLVYLVGRLSICSKSGASHKQHWLPSLRRCYSEAASFQDSHVHNIRNIGIIAHVDAGKTTTTERMLYFAGLTRSIGNVEHGNTVTDFLPLEREKGITIQSAAITMHWPTRQALPPGDQQKTINLIDTPGHSDFIFEVIRSVVELDGAIVILDGTKGVETNTEKVWGLTRQYNVPSLIYVNKHDQDGASYKRSIHDIATMLGTFPLVCQIPWWDKEEFVGHVDVIEEVGIKYSSMGAPSRITKKNLPPQLVEELEKARSHLIDTLADNDDILMEEFGEFGDVSVSSIKKSIRKLNIDGRGKFTPVFCGASKQNMGVQPLMDAVIDYLPSPAERPELKVLVRSKPQSLTSVLEGETRKKGHSLHRPPITGIGHVFKNVDDPQRGMISYVRVHHGTLAKAELYNTREHKFERPNNIMQISADKTRDITQLSTGHIGALTGLKGARTGDTLLAFSTHRGAVPEGMRDLHIRQGEVPPAVAFITMEPYRKTGLDKLEDALSRMSRVDPSLRFHTDEKTGQLIVSGLGLLHLEIARDRLKNFYKVTSDDVLIGEIEVEYRETLQAPTSVRHEQYERTIGGKAGKAGCTVEILPLEEHHHDSLLESCIEKDGNIIDISIPLPEDTQANGTSALPFDPEATRQQLLNGVTAGLARGPRRGSPMRRCLVKLTFDPQTDFHASTTPGHVQEAAFHAVRGVLKDAHAQGAVGVLEPFMRVRITAPEPAAAGIQHDLTSRRGGQVLEVRVIGEDALPTAGAESPVSGESGLGIDLSKVYAPPDPYDSVYSLRDKKGRMRMVEIVARAPLKEMLQYDVHLRELTSGRNQLSMEQDGFELVVGPRLKALDTLG